MKNLSTAFKRALATNQRNYLTYADITLADDTVLNLTNAELWSNGFEYEEIVSEDETFTALGSAVIGTARLIINNMTEAYSDYDFTNASAILYIGMQFQEGGSTRLEKLRIGTYTVDGTSYNGALITLTLLDNMEKFDRPYASNLTYPITLFNIVQDACTKCGVSLKTLQFPRYNLVMSKKPDTDSRTYRDVISWCAAIAGCFAKCDPEGRLELKWFDQTTLEQELNILDGGTITPWSTGDNYSGGTISPWSEGDVYDGGTGENDLPIHFLTSLFSQNIAVDDVVITGINVTVDEGDVGTDPYVVSKGTAGYVISIEGNKLITRLNANNIATYLGNQLIGLRFRKLNITHTNNPSIESGDIAVVYDRKGRGYATLVTRVNFQIGAPQTLVCGAETPSRNKASYYSDLTKNIVDQRKLLQKQKTAYDIALEQLDERLDEKEGLYSTIEQTQSGNIYYLHDQPTLEDSAVVWKMTRDAWGVTTNYDGDDTVWNGGMTVDGDAITRILSTIGINFGWGVGGQLIITDTNDNETFFADADTGVVRINASSFTLAGKSIEEIAHENDVDGGNLLLNPISMSALHWTRHGVVTTNQTDPYGGTKAIKLTPTTDEAYIQAKPDVNNPFKRMGVKYRFSVWLKASATHASTNTIYLMFNGIAFEINPTTSWKEYSVETMVSELSTSTPNDLVTIGGFGSFTPSDGYALYIYRPRVSYAATQEETFNDLTNNGAIRGIYMKNGQLYINMDYLQTGTAKIGGLGNENGLIEVYDNNKVLRSKIDNEGFWFTPTGNFRSSYVKLTDGGMEGYQLVSGQNQGGTKYGFEFAQNAIDAVIYFMNNLRFHNSPNAYDSIIIKTGLNSGIYIYDTIRTNVNFNEYVNINGRNGSTGNSLNAAYDIHTDGNVTCVVCYESSDRQLKKNIKTIDTDIIDNLRVVSFDWKKTDEHVSAGMIAQEVQEICPELVKEQHDGMLTLNYTGVIPHLVHKVQTQQKQINDLETRIAKLESMMEAILNG